MQSRDADYLREIAVRCDRLARSCSHDRTKRELEKLSLELAEKALQLNSDFADPATAVKRTSQFRWSLNLTPFEVSIVLVGLCTVVMLTIDSWLKQEHLIFGYLVPIFYIAGRYGGAPALMAALMSVLSAAFFFYPPKYSIYVAEPQSFIEMFFFAALALLATQFIAGRRGRRSRTPPSD